MPDAAPLLLLELLVLAPAARQLAPGQLAVTGSSIVPLHSTCAHQLVSLPGADREVTRVRVHLEEWQEQPCENLRGKRGLRRGATTCQRP